MGGKALKHAKTERKSAEEYYDIAADVVSKCKSFCSKCHPIPAYRNKESFGDGDFVVVVNDYNTVDNSIKEIFKPVEMKRNGSCISFDYRGMQIDLILCNEDTYETSLTYFSYNDLGNLIGRIAHKLGFKYGHKGLLLPVRRGDDHIVGEIFISRDYDKILSFLGYNPEVFNKGFDNLEDIFAFACSTKYFNKAIYSYEALNHINRVRQRKRKVYQQFLDYVATNEEVAKHTDYEFLPKGIYLEEAKEFFPEAEIDRYLFDIYLAIQKHEDVKKKFNGDLVKQWINDPDLSGIILGKVINHVRSLFSTKQQFEDFILSTDQTVIISLTKYIHNHIVNL